MTRWEKTQQNYEQMTLWEETQQNYEHPPPPRPRPRLRPRPRPLLPWLLRRLGDYYYALRLQDRRSVCTAVTTTTLRPSEHRENEPPQRTKLSSIRTTID